MHLGLFQANRSYAVQDSLIGTAAKSHRQLKASIPVFAVLVDPSDALSYREYQTLSRHVLVLKRSEVPFCFIVIGPTCRDTPNMGEGIFAITGHNGSCVNTISIPTARAISCTSLSVVLGLLQSAYKLNLFT